MNWQNYYNKTQDSPADPTLKLALSLVGSDLPKIAIDCGCGAGRNVAFLRSQGFEVFAFDKDECAIKICSERFNEDQAAHFSCDSFLTFEYPQAALVIASFSLFFCPANEFERSWESIRSAVIPGGVFYGTFLGPRDSWALEGSANAGALPVIFHAANEVKALFDGFEIEEFDERDFDGKTASGAEKHWNTFSVIARKNLA